jgi:hypothetical protein
MDLCTENKEDLMKQAKEVLNDIAPEYLAKVKATKDDAKPVPELRFFYEGPQVIIRFVKRGVVYNWRDVYNNIFSFRERSLVEIWSTYTSYLIITTGTNLTDCDKRRAELQDKNREPKHW